MTFKLGESVRILAGDTVGQIGRVSRVFPGGEFQSNLYTVLLDGQRGEVYCPEKDLNLVTSNRTAIDPNHYKFPGGIEVRQISAHLTSFGGQALQYIARATRLDGNNKGEAVEDLEKAVRLIQWEIERLQKDNA